MSDEIDFIDRYLYLVPGGSEWVDVYPLQEYMDGTYYRDPVSGFLHRYRAGLGWLSVNSDAFLGLPPLPFRLYQGMLFNVS